MYKVSDDFHQAIRNGEPQVPLFLFDNALITAQHIDISDGGITFFETCNEKDDFTPGCCSAATLNFHMYNLQNQWDDFEFGDFTAKLGVRTKHEEYSYGNSVCLVPYGDNVIAGYKSKPYLRFNGVSFENAESVNLPVQALLLLGTELYVFMENSYVVYRFNNTDTLTEITGTLSSSYLELTAENWKTDNLGIAYNVPGDDFTAPLQENNLVIYNGTYLDRYEMVPLGQFVAEKPMFSYEKVISVESYDRISLLDKNYEDQTKPSYPITLYNLAKWCCNCVGITMGSSSFTNSSVTLKEAPDDFDSATLREIMQWIGEIAGCYIKMSRDGELEFRWLTDTSSFSLTDDDYDSCSIAYYEAAPVNKVVIRNSGEDDSTASNVQTGDTVNCLCIQNNPIVRLLT